MINILNKSDDEIKTLTQKYEQLLIPPYIKTRNDIGILAQIYDVGFNYVNGKYQSLQKEWKAWIMVILKNQYFNGKLINIEIIQKLIDEFIVYRESKYNAHCEYMEWSDEYSRDSRFVFKFIEEKNGGL